MAVLHFRSGFISVLKCMVKTIISMNKAVYQSLLICGVLLTAFLFWFWSPNLTDKKFPQQNTPLADDAVFSDNANGNVNTEIQIWSHGLQKWRQNHTVCQKTTMDHEGFLNSSIGTIPMSVYDPKDDIFISRRIVNTNDFDGAKRRQIVKILELDSSLNFIDFGCNIGVYTLTAAKMGRHALCIDALYLNVQHVCTSVSLNNMQGKVTIILNAISNHHDTVDLAIDFKNMGGTFIDNNADFVKQVKGKSVTGLHYNKVTTITVDDLLKLPFIDKFKNVFIKMDIEGFEERALAKADDFFRKIFIRGVLMEWIFHRKKETGFRIIRFMKRHKFMPYTVNLKKLSHSPRGDWPYQDVLWLKI